ncbi:Peptidyl-prolyl cis-trans isomerase [Actinidia chinensis var. chinensis]|uniref:peptidylprolyl isomerase n=1 Tax=Actinidia chinensis var. chinensis TaxID=1590841 RepID=A0A2R6RRI9_ACTCC|nr:Peptidyl-prolyl cis-trans isomerase [Actinidia chinensis var. chinensis]
MAVEEDAEQEFAPQKKKSASADDKRRKKLAPGGLLKAVMRSGAGDSTPSDGDQVIFHCTIRTLDGVVVESTRSEFGGNGTPLRHVLGKSKMILGLLEGIPTMQKGEIAMFKMKPELHYGEEDCPLSVSDSFPKDVELHFEIELIDFSKVKVICEDLGVVKKVIDDGQGWESPREPYEVNAWISAKVGDGKLILSRTQGEPAFFTFGKSEVRDMLGDGRLIKRRIRDGRGEFPMDCPLHDSLLRVHYKGMLLSEEKLIFYDTKVDNDGQPLEFSSGEGLVPEGLEMCVRLMLPGEMALVTSPLDYAYDKFPRPANVPEGAHVQWEIELLGFEMPKDWTGLNFREIMDEVDKIKGTGNRLFKEGKFELAKAKYEKVLREFNHVNPQDNEEGKEFSNTRNQLHLNVAACYLQMGECRKSIESSNKVLDTNPVHVKALYRRGMAYMSAGEFEEAKNDFNKMMSADKSAESNATTALLKLKQREQEVEKKARKQFKGLFDKKPGEIAEVGTVDRDLDQVSGENPEKGSENDPDGDNEEQHREAAAAAAAAPPRMSFFSLLWPTGKRLFRALGVDRCSIL